MDPEAFFDHYTANGWIVGKAKARMKDWKAAVRNWERNAPDLKPKKWSLKDTIEKPRPGPPELELFIPKEFRGKESNDGNA